jgi:hypothetical protein
MSSGRKESPEKSVSPLQPGTIPDRPDAPGKSGETQGKTGFAQGTFYRQGVRVPGGPGKSAIPRTRNR